MLIGNSITGQKSARQKSYFFGNLAEITRTENSLFEKFLPGQKSPGQKFVFVEMCTRTEKSSKRIHLLALLIQGRTEITRTELLHFLKTTRTEII